MIKNIELIQASSRNYGRVLALICLLFFLSACGGGSKEGDDGQPVPQIVSVAPSTKSLVIDLNTSQSITFQVVTTFDDDSKTTAEYKAIWDAENGALQVTDENDVPVDISYNVEGIKDGSATDVEIEDETLSEAIKISVSLLPKTNEDNVTISLILPQILTNDLFPGDAVLLKIKAKKSDGSIVENALPQVACTAETNSYFTVTDSCEVSAIAAGEASVEVALVSDSSISANITITVKPTLPAVSVSKVLIQPLAESVYINDVISLVIKAENSDGSEIEDASSMVVCSVSDESVATIDSNCNLTGISEGNVDVGVSLKDNSKISATINIQILPPFITKIYFNPGAVSVEVGKTFQLTVEADMSDGSIRNTGLFDEVRCVTSSPTISVNDICLVSGEAVGNGLVSLELINTSSNVQTDTASVEVLAPLSVTSLTVNHASSSLFVGKSKKLQLSALMSDGSTIADASTIAKCIDISTATSPVTVTDDCTVTGLLEGSAEISAELFQSQTNAPGVTTFILNIVALPAVLDSTPVVMTLDDFQFVHQFQAPGQGVYKVKLYSDDGSVIDTSIEFRVFPIPGAEVTDLTPHCYNRAWPDNNTVACGIDRTGVDDKIYVHLDVAEPVIFNGTLELTYDDDILNNDDNGTQIASGVADYLLITADSPYLDGHVTSNMHASSESRYRTNIDNGLIPGNSAGYQAKVIFQPNELGEYNFTEDNVLITWSTKLDEPGITFCSKSVCTCNLDVEMASYSCDVSNLGQAEIFVTVFGADPLLLYGLKSSADGELSYSVEINNKP